MYACTKLKDSLGNMLICIKRGMITRRQIREASTKLTE